MVGKGVDLVAGSEPSVLDLLRLVRFSSPRSLVVKASRALLLVFVGYIIGYAVRDHEKSDVEKSIDRVEQRTDAIMQAIKQSRSEGREASVESSGARIAGINTN